MGLKDNKTKKNYPLIDMLMPTDDVISIKYGKIKYKDREIEIWKNVAPQNYQRASNSGSTGYHQERDI